MAKSLAWVPMRVTMRIFIGSRIVVRTSQGEQQGTVIETRPGGARVLFQNGSSDWVQAEDIASDKDTRQASPRSNTGSANRSDSGDQPAPAPRPKAAGPAAAPAPPALVENPYTAPSEGAHSSERGPGRPGLFYLFFSFEGRISRSEYWFSLGILMVVPFLTIGALTALIAHENGPFSDRAESIGWLLALGAVVSVVAVGCLSIAPTAKRWHDRNRTAWVMLFSLIPFIGGLWSLWSLIELGFLPGTPGRNRFGPAPDDRSPWPPGFSGQKR